MNSAKQKANIYQIRTLGEAKITSPVYNKRKDDSVYFLPDGDKGVILETDYNILSELIDKSQAPDFLEKAGPREKIFFDASKLNCAIVTCGGLCPGLNAIIRSVVLELHYNYEVRKIFGIRFGLQGFIPGYGHDFMDLTPAAITEIHAQGGSILGSSRGPQDMDAIVDCLEVNNINVLLVVGGDGSLTAAHLIAAKVLERSLKISVVGIPKTIDNDIYMLDRSFGFDTAVEIASLAIQSAHNEAKGFPNGIGLIKLMGRNSGFIAATATVAQQDVNFLLVPEIEFDIEGQGGLLEQLKERLNNRHHAVIVVAEGAGQQFFKPNGNGKDASGNIKLNDIGLLLKQEIERYFKAQEIDINLKYIDPSYIIRSLAPNANDRVFCNYLGRNAVHAAMTGRTDMVVGYSNGQFVHVPLEIVAGKRKHINPCGELWRSALETTGQKKLKAV